jgi:uncharacterized membrane protein HdeD (DUF308 family)
MMRERPTRVGLPGKRFAAGSRRKREREDAVMTDRAMSVARDHAPWRKGTPWWVTGVQGVVLILVGLYLLLAPASAAGVMIQLIALALLIQSVLQIADGLRGEAHALVAYSMLQAGVGATIGLLLVLRSWLVPGLDLGTARTMLGLGLIVYALIGLAGTFLGGERNGSWLGPVVNAVLLIVLALLLLTSTAANGADRLAFLGWIALIGGVLLVVAAWYAYNRPKPA